MKIRIVTDSGSDLSDEEASELGISIVPLSIRFGEEELIDRVELGADEFYERMNNSEDVPKLPHLRLVHSKQLLKNALKKELKLSFV